MGYLTVAKTHHRIEVVKGSRFIAWVSHVPAIDEASQLIQTQRDLYPDASHHCYAYQIGQGQRFSDDGEPGGTAGRPMYEILKKRNLDYVLAVVTRYFGGTKLGAGGLVRAYGGSLAKALDEAGIKEIKDREALRFEVSFAQMDSVYRYLDEVPELIKEEASYSVRGLVLEISLLENDVNTFKQNLVELTRGDIRWLELV